MAVFIDQVCNSSLIMYYLGRISLENAKFEFILWFHRAEFEFETVREFEIEFDIFYDYLA